MRLRRIKKSAIFAKKNDVDFLVMIIPLREQIDERKFDETTKSIPLEPFLTIDEPEENLYRFLLKENIDVIRLSETFKKAIMKPSYSS